jgi:hypothetical protein
VVSIDCIKDDLMKELEDLEQEALEEQLLDVGPVADKLPSVPSAVPAAAARGNYDLQSPKIQPKFLN